MSQTKFEEKVFFKFEEFLLLPQGQIFEIPFM